MEFQESDIIFSEEYSSNSYTISASFRSRNKVMNDRKKDKQRSSSGPMNIPGSSSSSPSSSFRYDDGGYELDDFVNDNEIVPPHVIVDRRSSDDLINSYEKNVKGKKLFHVRNSILKLTGFL